MAVQARIKVRTAMAAVLQPILHRPHNKTLNATTRQDHKVWRSSPKFQKPFRISLTVNAQMANHRNIRMGNLAAQPRFTLLANSDLHQFPLINGHKDSNNFPLAAADQPWPNSHQIRPAILLNIIALNQPTTIHRNWPLPVMILLLMDVSHLSSSSTCLSNHFSNTHNKRPNSSNSKHNPCHQPTTLLQCTRPTTLLSNSSFTTSATLRLHSNLHRALTAPTSRQPATTNTHKPQHPPRLSAHHHPCPAQQTPAVPIRC